MEGNDENVPRYADPAIVSPSNPTVKSGKATASLICGIVALLGCIVTFIPGVILGILSLRDISRSGGRLKGKGLAIAGIVLSVSAIILMLVVTPFAFQRLREAAIRLQKKQQEQQPGKGQPFLDDKKDVPPGLEWSRDVIARNPGTFKVRVVSEGPIVVMAMSARVWQAVQDKKLRPADKSEVYLNADVKETTFEREITVPAGSTYIMIKNNSHKQTTIHLQVFEK